MDVKQTLLFDLGGVIVPWVGIESIMDMKDITREDVLQCFSDNTVFSQYEVGQCSDDAFIKAFIDQWGLETDMASAKLLWQSWVKPAYDGTKDAMTALRQNYRVACLSNTNALHWARLKDLILTNDYFDHAYASHLLGAAKPHAECYELAITDMGVQPEDVIFFDDTQVNIDTALSLGMEAHLVDRTTGVIPVLQRLNLI